MDSNQGLEERNHFDCEYCNKTFLFQSRLERHLLIHTKLKLFKCIYCSSSFSLKANLKVHIRIHTGTKPYKCPFPSCTKSFTQSNNLKVHLKTHNSPKFAKNLQIYTNNLQSSKEYSSIIQ